MVCGKMCAQWVSVCKKIRFEETEGTEETDKKL
jgi:hypothetical protein